jgi:O-acetyl-ADP-ribose deacetylase (regulator of RNase III)
MTAIRYVTGDATYPLGDGPKIIAHVVNDQGGWGRGFVVALSRRWSQPEEMYRMWAAMPRPLPAFAAGGLGSFELGHVQYVDIEPDLKVANMLAQHGIRHSSTAPRALDYEALARCLDDLTEAALMSGSSVHMPRIGTGLGGGLWSVIEEKIRDTLCFDGVPVTVYDLPE